MDGDIALYTVLDAAVGRLMAEDGLWDDVLPTLSDAERTALRDRFRRETPSARLGYPRGAATWPAWLVLLMGRQEDPASLGYSREVLPDGGRVMGMLLADMVEVWTIGRNANYTRLLAGLAQNIILTSLERLSDMGAAHIAYRGAREISPLLQYLPDDLWGWSQTWSLVTDHRVVARPADVVLTPPAYVGLLGEDLGGGVAGQVKVRRMG